MMGYGSRWTGGWNAVQWRFLLKRHNVTEFTFVTLHVERDRVVNTLDFEVFVLGLRFWFCWSLEGNDAKIIN